MLVVIFLHGADLARFFRLSRNNPACDSSKHFKNPIIVQLVVIKLSVFEKVSNQLIYF